MSSAVNMHNVATSVKHTCMTALCKRDIYMLHCICEADFAGAIAAYTDRDTKPAIDVVQSKA